MELAAPRELFVAWAGPALAFLAPRGVTLYIDPGCPFGFNAQGQEPQRMWRYGHSADVERRMIVLSERSSAFEEVSGLTLELVVAQTHMQLAKLYGMPMAPSR
jgi:hypothetical protein